MDVSHLFKNLYNFKLHDMFIHNFDQGAEAVRWRNSTGLVKIHIHSYIFYGINFLFFFVFAPLVQEAPKLKILNPRTRV